MFKNTDKKYEELQERIANELAEEKARKKRALADIEKELDVMYLGSLDIDTISK